MSPLKRKRLKVIFFLVYISASSLRPILVKPPTAADRPCDQRIRSIIRPQPIHHNRQPRARPSPHAAASLALASAQRSPSPPLANRVLAHAQRMPLAARRHRQVRITGSPLRHRRIVPSRRRAEWQARWLPAAASPPTLLRAGNLSCGGRAPSSFGAPI